MLALHHGSDPLVPLAADGTGCPDQGRLAVWLSDLAGNHPEVQVTERACDGAAVHHLVEQGAEQDLVVVGRHVSGGASSVLGQGLAVSVVEHAPTTVAVVPLP